MSKEPIVTSIFSELTVLGFLAMLCFLIVKFGLSHVSLMVFGDEAGTPEHEENKEKLTEMLESIHMIIFLVMVIFIFEALGMIYVSDLESEKFQEYEGEVLTLHQRLNLVGRWKKMNEDENKPGAMALFFGWSSSAREYNKTQAIVRFMLMRQEFINDEANEDNALKRDFRFHMYLTKVMGERLGHMIELPWSQWVMLELWIMLFLVTAVSFKGSWLFVLITWLISSWALVVVAHIMLSGLHRTQDRMTHACRGLTMLDAEDAIGDSASTEGSGSTTEEGSGEGTGNGEDPAPDEVEKTEETPLVDKDTAKVDVETAEHADANHPGGLRKWIRSRPQYLDDETLDEGPWWVPDCIREMPNTKNRDQIRFYNLFVLGKGEVRFHLFLIRFLFLASALFLSVFCLNAAPMYIDEAYSWPAAIVLTTMGIMPIFVVYFFYLYHILDASVLVTSVEFFRVRRTVMAVVRHQKEDRAVMLLRIIVALHDDKSEDTALDGTLAKMQTVLNDPEAQKKKKINQLLEAETSLELEHLADIFDNLDVDKSGSLSHAEIQKLLAQFGFNMNLGEESDAKTAEVLRASMSKYSNSPTIQGKEGGEQEVAMTKAEFLTWMLNKAHQAEDLEPEEVAHFIFSRWDTDEEGKLSVEELLKGFASLGEAFTTNEVATLVVELDMNDDGEFDHEEFAMWVERHSNEGKEASAFSCCGLCD